MSAALSSYKRRNNPAEHTGWGPREIHAYMQWQLDQYQRGKIRRGDLGGHSWKLPKKSETGEPATLPADVLAFSKPKRDESKKKRKRSSSSSSAASEEEDDEEEGTGSDVEGFKLRQEDEEFFLLEVARDRRVQLAKLKKKKGKEYVLYTADGKAAIAGGNPGDDTPEYCHVLFSRVYGDDKKLKKEKKGKEDKLVAADFSKKPMMLKGMTATGAAL